MRHDERAGAPRGFSAVSAIPAERKIDVAALGELAVAGMAVDLQDPLEAVEMGDRPLGLAELR